MSGGDYFSVPRNVVLDDGVLYRVIYEDGKILTTSCKQKIHWLRMELKHLVSFWLIFAIHFPTFLTEFFRFFFHISLFYNDKNIFLNVSFLG